MPLMQATLPMQVMPPMMPSDASDASDAFDASDASDPSDVSGLPGRLEACPNNECQEGLNCVDVQGTKTCYAPCAEDSECGAAEQCLQDNFFLGSANDHCFPNLCQPASGGLIGIGLAQEADFGGLCNAGGNDGVCMGSFPFDTPVGAQDIGLCFDTSGDLAVGDACSSTAPHSDASLNCGSGSVCVNEQCRATCLNGEACPDGTSCQNADLAGNSVPGFCL